MSFEWEYFSVCSPEDGRKFFAIADDGSLGEAFLAITRGNVLNFEGKTQTIDEITDQSFFMWAYLPDEFLIFFEDRNK